ncbi:hypothetical protein VNO78_22661 [Psophocarpus tetragonolobus]|uniref:Uncharacterized protein n=1 Tax=Psophocarpus tetragonolobus TaxID=3891 RepID=A0AAN9S1Z9_PSOTE
MCPVLRTASYFCFTSSERYNLGFLTTLVKVQVGGPNVKKCYELQLMSTGQASVLTNLNYLNFSPLCCTSCCPHVVALLFASIPLCYHNYLGSPPVSHPSSPPLATPPLCFPSLPQHPPLHLHVM